VEVVERLLSQQGTEDAPLSEKENNDKLIFRMCLSKKVTRQYLIYLLNSLQHQLKHVISSCPSSKGIDIINSIKATIERVRAQLNEQEQALLFDPSKEPEEEDANIYIE
jgi:hypothetical protein